MRQDSTVHELVTQRGATRVVFGAGILAAHAAPEIARLGVSRVLVVATPGRKSQAEELATRLGSRSVGTLATAKEHVPRAVADEAEKEARRLGADAVFAVGGGSAIGLAKAIALRTEGAVKVIAAPTTYSGSELTAVWGMTEGGVKTTGKDERVRAALVFYDPTLTLGLPLATTIASAWNAMAHAVEALWSPGVDDETARAAEESVARFAPALRALMANPGDLAARTDALYAAYLASQAIANATMGLHHKICHVLGGRGLPHAETHACVLPYVVAFNHDHAEHAMAALSRALDGAAPAGALFELARETDAPTSLADLGLPGDAIPDVVREVLAAKPANPRPLDERSLLELIGAAWEKKTMHDDTFPTLAGGFGSAMESEALPGALPTKQNAPRKAPYGLYPELVSGVPFTMRRMENTRLWTYRIRPSSAHGEFRPLTLPRFTNTYATLTPNRIRWKPMPIPTGSVDFLDGMTTLGGLGEPAGGPGYAVHLYAASASMNERSFLNADGDMMIVPQDGVLVVRTECGPLRVAPGEILLVPRGVRFAVDLPEKRGRGYVCEVFGARFRLPERGPIGSNGLADNRHFLAPRATWEDKSGSHRIVNKLGGALWTADQQHSPFDVVAWHGNHVPYKYDLMLFNAMGSTTWDHPDPSIHTVLTAPLDDHGRALVDFVCFRGRWDVTENSFRPPFSHRNAATEVNGVIRVQSVDSGYEPGCAFVTPMLTSHGVSVTTYEHVFAQTDEAANTPHRLSDDSLWIMFESALPFRLTTWALESELVDRDFPKMFEGLKSHFSPNHL